MFIFDYQPSLLRSINAGCVLMPKSESRIVSEVMRKSAELRRQSHDSNFLKESENKRLTRV